MLSYTSYIPSAVKILSVILLFCEIQDKPWTDNSSVHIYIACESMIEQPYMKQWSNKLSVLQRCLLFFFFLLVII